MLGEEDGSGLVDRGARTALQLPVSMDMDAGQAPTHRCAGRLWPGRLHSSAPYEHHDCLRATDSSSPSLASRRNTKGWEGKIHPKTVGTHQLPQKLISGPRVSSSF